MPTLEWAKTHVISQFEEVLVRRNGSPMAAFRRFGEPGLVEMARDCFTLRLLH